MDAGMRSKGFKTACQAMLMIVLVDTAATNGAKPASHHFERTPSCLSHTEWALVKDPCPRHICCASCPCKAMQDPITRDLEARTIHPVLSETNGTARPSEFCCSLE
jgi:hypothetical protein